MKVFVHYSHSTTPSNYDKSCSFRRTIMLWWESHMPLCVKQIPPLEECDGMDPANFCLILVNEVNIQGQKTLK